MNWRLPWPGDSLDLERAFMGPGSIHCLLRAWRQLWAWFRAYRKTPVLFWSETEVWSPACPCALVFDIFDLCLLSHSSGDANA